MKTAAFILGAVCVVLAIVLAVVHNQANNQKTDYENTILVFSNQWVNASLTNNELRQVNLILTNALAASQQDATSISNTLVQTVGSLQDAQTQITNLDARVADLQAQNKALDDHAAELTNTISSLSQQITDTQNKLAASETNNAFLESELKKQLAEKDELQRKFNDLKAVKAQVSKLRDDALVAQRLDWIRRGIDPAKIMKGGEAMMQLKPVAPTNSAPAVVKPTRPKTYDLNVEVGSDGSVHVLQPSTSTTNSP